MIETLASLLLIGILGTMSPGPDFFLVLRNSLNYPFKIALMTVLGILMGLVFHLLVNIFGLTILIQESPRIFLSLKFAGGAYLMYIGINSIRINKKIEIKNDSPPSKIQYRASYKKAFFEGLWTNLLNVKAMLFFFGIFTQIIDKNTETGEKLVYASLFLGQNLIYWSCLVYFIKKTRIESFFLKHQLKINRTLGIILIAFGAQVLLDF